jgi:hypothetical protein
VVGDRGLGPFDYLVSCGAGQNPLRALEVLRQLGAVQPGPAADTYLTLRAASMVCT